MSDTATAWVLILAAVGPGLLLLGLLNTVSLRLRPRIEWRVGRPWGPLWIAFSLGVAAAWPAWWLECGLSPHEDPWRFNNLGAFLLFWIIVAGAVEECCKFAVFHLGPARTRWFREEYDGILLGGAVALGFATIENLLYVRQFGLEVARLRAFTAVPAHAMFGVIMGASLGMARCRARWKWSDMGLPLSGLALAIAAHGLYDALASLGASASLAALVGFVAFMLALLTVSVRLGWHARRFSPAFGGQRRALPPPHGSLHFPSPPLPRDPSVAALLGLVPGLGQVYNGEGTKALLFLAIGTVNLGLYWIAHTFATAPATAIRLLESMGLSIVITPQQLEQAVQQRWLLEPILLYLVLIWEAVGALDAWLTARKRWRHPQLHAIRRSFATHGFGASYVAHLMVIFLLVMAPVIHEACGGDAHPPGADTASAEGRRDSDGTAWKLTWVKAPDHMAGWQNTAEGRREGTPPRAGAAPSSSAGDTVTPSVGSLHTAGEGLPAGASNQRRPGGERGSYTQYLSYQIRRNHADMHFFRRVPATTWAVVHYRIARDGRLISAELVKHSGDRIGARRAVEVIERAAPFQPFPDGNAKELDVVELFWSIGRSHPFAAQSLEFRLSRMPDGRQVEVIR